LLVSYNTMHFSLYYLSLHDALPILTATRPCCPTTHCQLPVVEINTQWILKPQQSSIRGDGPLWNLSSKGGMILRALLNRVFEERSEEHTSELQSRFDLVCRLLLEIQ